MLSATPPSASKRIHSEDEDGSKALSSHTLTRAPSFRKKQPSFRKKSNADEIREKLLSTIDKMRKLSSRLFARECRRNFLLCH
jgi:hypothetical protein